MVLLNLRIEETHYSTLPRLDQHGEMGRDRTDSENHVTGENRRMLNVLVSFLLR